MGKKGFTILEFLVAIGIGLLVIHGITAVLLKNLSALKNAAGFQKASFLCSSQMEILCAAAPGQMKEGTYEFDDFLKKGMEGKGRGEIFVTPYEGKLKKVEVVLKWKEGKKPEREVRLVTLRRQ